MNRAPDPRFNQLVETVRAFDWMQRAACLETGDVGFFPESGSPTAAARAVCRRCPVQDECLTFALMHGIDVGIWGGMSAGERRRLRFRLQG